MSDHDETMVDARLRAAGAALRDEAPGTDDVDGGFDRLVERSGRRTWWLAPTIIGAAAAAAIGIVAITGADQTVRQVPVDTGVVPTVPATDPAPRPAPNTTPATTRSTATAAPDTLATPATAAPDTLATPATAATAAPTTPATVAVTAPVAAPPTAPTTPATTTALAPATDAPTTTAAPTTTEAPTTTAAPTTAAPKPPVFAGDPPLSTSARLLGCPGTLGDVAAVIPSERTPVTALGCSSNTGAEFGTATGTAIAADGGAIALTYTAPTWSVSSVAPDPSLALPIPPAELLEAAAGDTGPFDDTEDVRSVDDVPPGTDPATFATTIGQRLAAAYVDPIPDVTTTVLQGADAVVITLTGIGDDSANELVYVVWYEDVDGVLTATRAAYSPICARGVSDSEPYPLCV